MTIKGDSRRKRVRLAFGKERGYGLSISSGNEERGQPLTYD
jgi:hypothetical protein